MPRLNIPERYREGLSKLRTLDDPSLQEIRAAIEQLAASHGPDDGDIDRLSDLQSALSSTGSAHLRRDLRQIAEAIAGLYSARAARDVSLDEFANKVSDAMESLDSDEFRLPHAERELFRTRLLTLLGAEFFAVISKAVDLATEDERTFCQARILTDLRPVFGSHIEDGLKGMVVVHLLKLDYHQSSPAHHQFYVALNAQDLRELRRVIDRAEAKANTLRSATKGIRLFGVPKEQK